jgi:predicted nucleic acid-binding Zn ribbon protein
MTWRPLPPPGGGEPRPIREALDRLAGRTGSSRPVLATVFGRWAEVVGTEVAAHARPVAIRHGALVVAVDDPTWASQLRWLGPDLLARLAEAAGEPVADRLEVRVGRR